MNLKDYKGEKPKKLFETDRIFLAKLNELVREATKRFSEYEYSKAKSDIENFFWSDFADNYLEIVKNRVYGKEGEEKNSALYTLHYALLTILKLFAPIIPFITEEIYQENYRNLEKSKSIHISSWPEKIKIDKKKNDDEVYNLFLKIITAVRQEKSLAKKSMKSRIILTINKKDKKILNGVLSDLAAVTNSEKIEEGLFRVQFVED
jgi:valyl-tRNA synthetase